MKVRMDFVTNSSSSSFLIAFKDKIEGIEKINSLRDYYGGMYMDELCHDFIAAAPIPVDELEKKIWDEFADDVFYATENCVDECGHRKKSFQEKWLEDHPEKDWRDYYKSPELEAETSRITKEKIEEVRKDLDGKDYLVLLEYEDDNQIGSELEHEILPGCDFTVRRFNHH